MSLVGKYCLVDKLRSGRTEVFVLALVGKTYTALLANTESLLLDYVVHKITGPLLSGKITSAEEACAEARALAEEGKRLLGLDGGIEDLFVTFKVSALECAIQQDSNKEEYWEVSEESSEDSYYEDEEESE